MPFLQGCKKIDHVLFCSGLLGGILGVKDPSGTKPSGGLLGGGNRPLLRLLGGGNNNGTGILGGILRGRNRPLVQVFVGGKPINGTASSSG